jgi:hypothetical protein
VGKFTASKGWIQINEQKVSSNASIKVRKFGKPSTQNKFTVEEIYYRRLF